MPPYKPTHSQTPQSISTALSKYTALHSINPQQANLLLASLKSHLRTQPVSELDVQNIWRSFSNATDWFEWLDALLYSIVKFDVLDCQPAGGYIELFIETEMLAYDEEGVARVVEMFEENRWRVACEREMRRRWFWRKGLLGF